MTLAKVVTTQPNHPDGTLNLHRYVDGTSAIALLGQRGVDPTSLLQHGFGNMLLLAIDTTFAVDELEGNAGYAERHGFAEWQRLRRGVLEAPASVETELKLSNAFRDRLRPWIMNGEISDMLRWTPPTAMPDHRLSKSESGDGPEFLWFVERFTKTFLTDWTDESLAFEYRYVLEGSRPHYLPSELLLEREIAAAKICHEISSRAVHGKKTNLDGQIALVERALEAIRDQRRDIATAIFTAARALDSTDASLANNLGFCLIPDNPQEAIKVLAEARVLGQKNLLNFANTAAAHFVLGDLQGALEACDEARAFGLRKSHVAWLWELPVQGEPVLLERSPSGYICDLAVIIASSMGEESVADAWRTRRGYLYPASRTDSDE